MNLQAQLAYLKQQSGQQGQFSVPILSTTNPNLCQQLPGSPNLLQHQIQQMQVYNQTHLMNMTSIESSENSTSSGRNNNAIDPYSCNYDETNSQTLNEIHDRKWSFGDADDLRSVAFRYMQH